MKKKEKKKKHVSNFWLKKKLFQADYVKFLHVYSQQI